VRAVAVIGNLSKDTIDGVGPRVGGAPFHAARALRLLSGGARVVARCAQADRRALIPPLAALGVPWTWLPAERTATFELDYDGEERVLTTVDAGSPWTLDDARAVGRAAWVQAGALARTDFTPDVLELLARDRRLALDGQALARPAGDRDEDRELIRHVTVLKLGEQELAALGGEDEVASLGVPELLITYGSRGALVVAGGVRATVPIRKVETTDPTGAGDAFLAAYVWARAAGHRPTSAARHAATTAARVLELAAAPAA
jgi:sugar/nucleoside kinase (ribokinase family)